MKTMLLYPLILSFFQLAFISPVYANNDAMARAQFILRQVSAEKVKLTAENKNLSIEKESLEKKLSKLEKKYNKLTKKSSKKSSAMNKRIDKIMQRLNNEVLAHKKSRKKLFEMTNEKERLYGVATHQIDMINLCIANNKKLYSVNENILGQYEEKGIWSAISQAEPLTGLKQVEIENLVDDYQYRLDDLRVDAIQSELNPSL